MATDETSFIFESSLCRVRGEIISTLPMAIMLCVAIRSTLGQHIVGHFVCHVRDSRRTKFDRTFIFRYMFLKRYHSLGSGHVTIVILKNGKTVKKSLI